MYAFYSTRLQVQNEVTQQLSDHELSSTSLSSRAGASTPTVNGPTTALSGGFNSCTLAPSHGSDSQNTTLSPVSDGDKPSFIDSSKEAGVVKLYQMFPHTPEDVIKSIFDLSRGDLARASDCVLSGPSMEYLISFVSSLVLTSECESRTLKIDGDDQDGDDLVECVLAFHKGQRFDPHCSVRVCLSGQPAAAGILPSL